MLGNVVVLRPTKEKWIMQLVNYKFGLNYEIWHQKCKFISYKLKANCGSVNLLDSAFEIEETSMNETLHTYTDAYMYTKLACTFVHTSKWSHFLLLSRFLRLTEKIFISICIQQWTVRQFFFTVLPCCESMTVILCFAYA